MTDGYIKAQKSGFMSIINNAYISMLQYINTIWHVCKKWI